MSEVLTRRIAALLYIKTDWDKEESRIVAERIVNIVNEEMTTRNNLILQINDEIEDTGSVAAGIDNELIQNLYIETTKLR
jgi:hypothetical protein